MPNVIGTVDARPKLADVSAENHDVQNGTTRQLLAAARIIFVFSSLELGGAERQAMHLASYLKREFGSALEIWGFSPAGRVSELCQERGITCRSIDPPLQGGPASKLIGLTRFVKEMRGFRPTVLLPYTMSPNIICGLTWKYSGAGSAFGISAMREEAGSDGSRKNGLFTARRFSFPIQCTARSFLTAIWGPIGGVSLS